MLGVRTLDLADACAELEDAQVLRNSAFAHDLIAEAALASVPATIARQLHAEVAAFLQQREGEPARLAHHWLQAGDPAQAGTAFNAAAERSRKASSIVDSLRIRPGGNSSAGISMMALRALVGTRVDGLDRRRPRRARCGRATPAMRATSAELRPRRRSS